MGGVPRNKCSGLQFNHMVTNLHWRRNRPKFTLKLQLIRKQTIYSAADKRIYELLQIPTTDVRRRCKLKRPW